jgi:hypothetical protein
MAEPAGRHKRAVSNFEPADIKDKSQSQPPPKPRKRAKKVVDRLSRDHLLQSENSQLTTTNIHQLLLDPEAWTVLSKVEQTELLQLIPEYALLKPRNEPENGINTFALQTSEPWRTDIRLFVENLSTGVYESKTVAEATQASQDRAQGKFDKFKEEEFEEFWGQKQRVSSDLYTDGSTVVKLEDLVRAGIFETGDILSYLRKFGRGHLDKNSRAFLVEKECMIQEVNQQEGSLGLFYPPGQFKLSSTHVRDDLIEPDVTNLRSFETVILREDGRSLNDSASNPWKHFRCIRRNQDIGSLWELRQKYWDKHRVAYDKTSDRDFKLKTTMKKKRPIKDSDQASKTSSESDSRRRSSRSRRSINYRE